MRPTDSSSEAPLARAPQERPYGPRFCAAMISLFIVLGGCQGAPGTQQPTPQAPPTSGGGGGSPSFNPPSGIQGSWLEVNLGAIATRTTYRVEDWFSFTADNFTSTVKRYTGAEGQRKLGTTLPKEFKLVHQSSEATVVRPVAVAGADERFYGLVAHLILGGRLDTRYYFIYVFRKHGILGNLGDNQMYVQHDAARTMDKAVDGMNDMIRLSLRGYRGIVRRQSTGDR